MYNSKAACFNYSVSFSMYKHKHAFVLEKIHVFSVITIRRLGLVKILNNQPSWQKKMLLLYVTANHQYVTFVRFLCIISTFVKLRNI